MDILLNPNGTVVPTTVYSSPSSFGMNSAFYHFWLAERGDLFDPLAQPGRSLPAAAWSRSRPVDIPIRRDDSLGTLRSRASAGCSRSSPGPAQIDHQPASRFDFDGNNPSLPFLPPQQGVRGDTR